MIAYLNPILLSAITLILGLGVNVFRQMAQDINEIKIQLTKHEINSQNYEKRIEKLERWHESKLHEN